MLRKNRALELCFTDRGMGCACALNQLRILRFYVKMKHFEAHALVSSRVMNSKVLRMAIQFWVFFYLIRRQNGECMLEILWCELSWGVINGYIIWVRMSTTCIHLLQFKTQVTCKNADFKCRYIRTHPEEKEQFKLELELELCIKFQTLHSPFWIFLKKKYFNQIAMLSTLESTFLDDQMRFKIVYSNKKNAKSRVRQS